MTSPEDATVRLRPALIPDECTRVNRDPSGKPGLHRGGSPRRWFGSISGFEANSSGARTHADGFTWFPTGRGIGERNDTTPGRAPVLRPPESNVPLRPLCLPPDKPVRQIGRLT